MPKKKYSALEIVLPAIPQGSIGDTLEGCANRKLIGIQLGSGKGAPR